MAFSETFTHDIPRRIWSAYFDGLSQMYQGWRCNVEVISMDVGDQHLAENDRLWGLSFERSGSAANSILIETGDPVTGIVEHWAFNPIAVREANTTPGYEADVQVECSDGSMVIIRIQRRPELTAGYRAGQARSEQRGAPSAAATRSSRPFNRSVGHSTASRSKPSPARSGSDRNTVASARKATEPFKGSVLLAIAAGIGGLWLLSRMRAGRPKASSHADRACEPSSPAPSSPTRS